MERDLILAIEKVNDDYLKIINSKEYILGRKLFKIKDDLKNHRVIEFFKAIDRNRRRAKIHAENYKQKNNYNKDSYIDELRGNICGKTAVYTCIMGDYDKLSEPYYATDGFEYVIFTDMNIESKIWKKKKIPNKILKLHNAALINRYIKMHPRELFPNYDFTIYVDGKVTIISDLRTLLFKTNSYFGIAMHRHTFRDDIFEEINACVTYGKGNKKELYNQAVQYKKEGMPSNFGMLEAAVIVSDLKNKNAEKLFDEWWIEFTKSNSMRDQIALPYVIWKNHRQVSDIGDLGQCIERNPKFRINGLHG